MTLIDSFPRPGAFFSGSLARANFENLTRMSLLACPDATLAGDPFLAKQLRIHDVNLGLILNCRGVFIDPKTGTPPDWRPLERRIWGHAREVGALGAIEHPAWGTIQRIRWDVPALHATVAHELAAAAAAHQVAFIFLDEPAKDDAQGLARTLRLYASLVSARPLPVITNGTFGPTEAPGLVRGRFWQDLPSFYPESAVAGTPEEYFGWCHGTPAYSMAPEFLACLSAILGGPYFYTPTNGPFSFDWTPEPFQVGSFGKPFGSPALTGSLLVRCFEHANVAVNLSRDAGILEADTPPGAGPLSPLDWWVDWKTTEKSAADTQIVSSSSKGEA